MSLTRKISNFFVVLSLLGALLMMLATLSYSILESNAKIGNDLIKGFNYENLIYLNLVGITFFSGLFLFTHFISVSGLKREFDIINFYPIGWIIYFLIIAPIGVIFFTLGTSFDIGIELMTEVKFDTLPTHEVWADENARALLEMIFVRVIIIFILFNLLALATRFYFRKKIAHRKKIINLKS